MPGERATVAGCVLAIVVAFSYHWCARWLVHKRELPREVDIFVVSYPKSGNNWLRFLLAHTWLYGQPGAHNWHKEFDFHSIEDTIPDLEYGPNRYHFHSHEAPRMFKSHQPFAPEAVPGKCSETVGAMEDSQCSCPNCPVKWRRVLHLVRDGRDVMCSYYHFRKGLGNLEPNNMSFEDFLDAKLYPGYSWADHVGSYLGLEGNESFDVLTVKYEDLHANTRDSLVKIAKWAGLDHGEDIITRAIERSSFARMRQKEDATGLRIFDELYPHRDTQWRLTRKGKAGGWEECFRTQETKEKWNAVAMTTLRQLGYAETPEW